MGRRGRPAGPTAVGEATRKRLFAVAVGLFETRGYHQTTMRGIATAAGVSPGLLYRYFPSKGAVVMALYDALSVAYGEGRGAMPEGTWVERSLWALRRSVEVLAPHRATLAAILDVLLMDDASGLLAPGSMASRQRVSGMFEHAVQHAADAPPQWQPLARIAYVAHLAVLLWFLLDRSPGQGATEGLLALLDRVGPWLGTALWLPGAHGMVAELDELVQRALLRHGSP